MRILIAGAALAASGCWTAVPPPRVASLEPGDVKLAGTITLARVECASDGPCDVVVDGVQHVQFGPPQLAASAHAPFGITRDFAGVMYASEMVGKRVEVFGRRVDADHVTLDGKRAYYLRLADPPWPVPPGWRREQLPMPLSFAPSLPYAFEEIRFAPGFGDASSPDHWAYAFVWYGRHTEAPAPRPQQLATQLATYFRGLLTEVDGAQHRFDPRAITTSVGAHTVHVHLFDAFADAAPLDLEGTVRRVACERAPLWVFTLSRPTAPIRPALEALAARVPCPP